MITGKDVFNQMTREVTGNESATDQALRLGIDIDSIMPIIAGSKVDHASFLGGMAVGVELTKQKCHDPESNRSYDEFLESIMPDVG